MKLKLSQYYYCTDGKNPEIAKIRRYCAGADCPHLKTRPRKKSAKIKRKNRRLEQQEYKKLFKR